MGRIRGDRKALARLGGALLAVVVAAVAEPGLMGAAGAATPATRRGRPVRVVAAENFWGSIAGQVGGHHVQVTSIITNPNADPHAYEPTAGDARTLAQADVVIENGLGYDPWVARLLAADQSHPKVLDVGAVVGVAEGGNPHRWYNPSDVRTVIRQLVADLQKADPTDSAAFDRQRAAFTTVALRPYDQLIAAIKAGYSGTPVGASESIFAMLAPALGLNLITPPAFLRAISEGTDVAAADKATIDAQIRDHQIKVYVYNSQNATPDIQAQVKACRAAGILTTTITETLVPTRSTYQAWQVRQLEALQAALQRAGK